MIHINTLRAIHNIYFEMLKRSIIHGVVAITLHSVINVVNHICAS